VKKLLAIILILSLPVFILAESADPDAGIVSLQTDDSTGVVQFMTFFTLPACPPFLPAVDTFDVSAWIPEGSTWMLQPVNLLGTAWADMQPAIDGLEGMMVDIPLGFTLDYDSARVWVELHINQNTTYTPGFPVGTHTWPNGMYFEPLAGYPGEILWINVDFYSYLYSGVGDSVEYGTDLIPFISPLHVSYDAANIQPFVEGLPGYDPALGTFFNFVAATGALSSWGIVPDLFVDWVYDVYHFTPFIGAMNNGALSQTTISSVSVETEAGIVNTGWITQTEYDSDYFRVYRSAEVIATIPAAGTSSDPIAYEYTDNTAVGGVEYNYEISVVMTDASEWVYPEVFTVTPAGETTIHVPGDYPTIQAGIDAAGNGDEVVIADGIYTGAGNKNLDFGGRAITVRSENGAENCIIDCEDDGQGFYFHSGEELTSILDGFTITNGSAGWGGAIYCNNSSPHIMNCVLNGNTAYDNYGGGGGICCKDNANPFISNCLITENNCTSSPGGGGGICCESNSFPTINNCQFTSNTADNAGGGLCIAASSVNVYYSTFSNNLSVNGGGGGIYIQEGNLIIDKSTFSANTTNNTGGGIFVNDLGCIIMSNTIIEGSTNNAIHFNNSVNPSIIHSDFHNNAGGNFSGNSIPAGLGSISTVNANGDPADEFYNIFLDPLFVDPANDDYNLQASSPCIDAGDPTTSNDPDGTIADIGAFYFDQTQPSTPVEDLVISVVGDNVVLNWEDVAGASGYNVYRSSEPYFEIGGLTPIAEPAMSTFEDVGVLSGGAQFYIVTWEN